LRIIPFRGEYFRLRQQAKHLVTGLIYPLADRRLPFLGVHLTRTIDGEVLVGPNAVFALHREGYHAGQVHVGDMIDSLGYAGFWRLVAVHIGAGLGEMLKAWSVSAFTRAARKLVPELKAEDFVAARAGVRAQAVDAKGRLVDDFRFVRANKWLHVINAPSPAATACFAIGEMVAEQV
jgi:L-2-hydroxyglutarate oxidase